MNIIKLWIIAIILCIAVSCEVDASDDWSESDKARQVVLLATLAADYAQTQYIFNHPLTHAEGNPLIKDPASYFALCALASTYIVDVLPKEYRSTAQHAVIITQMFVTVRNNNLGIKGNHTLFVGYTHYF